MGTAYLSPPGIVGQPDSLCVCVCVCLCVCVCVHITFEAGHVIKEEMEYVNEYGTEMKSVCCVWLG